MTDGVIYYNVRTGCAVRLLVSIYSLRKHYTGPITILSRGDESHELCSKIAAALNVDMKEIEFPAVIGHNAHYLAKTKLHEVTPYSRNVFIDADTIVVGKINELFDAVDDYTFMVTRMVDWGTSSGAVGRRIKQWLDVCPELIQPAVDFGLAINTGVFGFGRDCKLMHDWYGLASQGQDLFIPDEISCQLLLPKHKHNVMSDSFNKSCKFGKIDGDTRIIHFHGRKHCRENLPFNGNLWVAIFNEVRELNIADVSSWMPGGDRMLRRFLTESTGT